MSKVALGQERQRALHLWRNKTALRQMSESHTSRVRDEEMGEDEIDSSV